MSDYYRLVKPGIVYGNMLHFSAGMLLGSTVAWDSIHAVAGFIATALVVMAGAAINNVLDRNIDQVMARTKHRPTADRSMTAFKATMFGTLLGLAGFGLLALTNKTTFVVGLIGFVGYAFIYTLAKRKTVQHTLIGAVPGALPAVAGYTALTGTIDATALWLFGVVFLWQLPHFYAIGVYRRKEYARAGIPLLSNRFKLSTMRRLIQFATVLYLIAALGLATQSLTVPAAALMVGVALWWLLAMIRDTRPADEWSRSVFRRSLVVALALPIVMIVNVFATDWVV